MEKTTTLTVAAHVVDHTAHDSRSKFLTCQDSEIVDQSDN